MSSLTSLDVNLHLRFPDQKSPPHTAEEWVFASFWENAHTSRVTCFRERGRSTRRDSNEWEKEEKRLSSRFKSSLNELFRLRGRLFSLRAIQIDLSLRVCCSIFGERFEWRVCCSIFDWIGKTKTFLCLGDSRLSDWRAGLLLGFLGEVERRTIVKSVKGKVSCKNDTSFSPQYAWCQI